MQIDTRGNRPARRKAKGASVVMAGMVGAVVGAVLCGGGVFAWHGAEVFAVVPGLIGPQMVMAGMCGAAVFAFFAAGIAYVLH